MKKARRTATVQVSLAQPPSYDEVAALIAPSAPPPWLREYLENWGPSVLLAGGVAAVQPTKAVMKERLVEVSAAAFLLNNALSDTASRRAGVALHPTEAASWLVTINVAFRRLSSLNRQLKYSVCDLH
jgi:hypothetical protein